MAELDLRFTDEFIPNSLLSWRVKKYGINPFHERRFLETHKVSVKVFVKSKQKVIIRYDTTIRESKHRYEYYTSMSVIGGVGAMEGP